MVENDLPIGSPLINVLAIEDTLFTQEELCFDQVQFIFESQTLVVKAITDTDEIELIQAPTVHACDTPAPEWARSLVGKKLQTLWTCENAQGYQDQIILAFGQLHPSLTLLAEGSVLKIFQTRSLQRQRSESVAHSIA